MNKKPSVFEYIDYKKYLSAWREMEKESNPGITLEYLSAKLGQKKNRTYFSDLEKGRRALGPEVFERLKKLIGFDTEESKYFRSIVSYAQSVTYDEREFWFEQAIQLNHTPQKIVDKTTYAYYKKWYHTTVRAYLETCNFKDEYREASKRLFGRVSPQEVKDAVTNLITLGLVAPDEHGYLKPVDKVLTTNDAVRNDLVQAYHLSNVDIFRAIVEQNKPGTYESRYLTVSVSPQALERIQRRISQLRSEITSIVHKDEDNAEMVYKIVIHTYPESDRS